MSFTIIDDRDPTVTYTGTWAPGGTTHEHAGTVSSSVKVGNHFSVPFTGTAIAVYGTFDASSAGVKTSYAIDGGAATTVTSGSSPLDSFQQLFWQSEAVPNGSHNLVVTMLAVNNVGDGEGTVWFDYFNVTTDATSPTSSSSPGTSSPATSLGPASNTASSPTSSSTAVAATIAKKASHSALIGGITAGVLVLLFAVGLLFLGLRRKRKYDNLSTPPGMSPTSIIPTSSQAPTTGLLGPEPMRTASYFSPATYGDVPGAPTGAVAPGTIPTHTHNAHAPLPGPAHMQYTTPPQSSYAPSEASTSQYTNQNRGPLSVVGGSSTAGSDSIADLKRRQQQVVNSYEEGISGVPPVQHVDSGVRQLAPAVGPGLSELPPVYTPN
ncbi:Amidohydro-rel domain-containing protein [Mycena venus]|uniref:Amidohydro-rel domain-containing protein n=1 Tax=Mycena venus TaxID=2733690 RepID=A0A8H6Z0U7_9AGAR|nr:Amidohydro-rel domain-containing protein [Mycena venus]